MCDGLICGYYAFKDMLNTAVSYHSFTSVKWVRQPRTLAEIMNMAGHKGVDVLCLCLPLTERQTQTDDMFS